MHRLVDKKLTPIDKINTYRSIDSKTLTAANSFYYEGVAFCIVKQNHKGKASSVFASYLYPSGHLITVDGDKENLKKRLEAGIDSVKTFIKENGIKGI